MRLLAQARILPGAWHVECETGEAQLEQDIVVGPAVFLPTVDAAPMHDHRRPMDPFGHLQVADDFFTFEGNLATLQQRVHIGRGFEKGPQRAFVTSHFLRAAWHRITADAVILIGEIESFTGCFFLALLLLFIAQFLVLSAELTPLAPPQVRIQTGETLQNLIDIFFPHPLERIDPSGAMRDVRGDFFEGLFRHVVTFVNSAS